MSGATAVVTTVTATPAQAAMPAFQMPFPCGEVWRASTYSGHPAIDWNAYPGDDNGRTVVASAAGTASLYHEPLGGYQVIVTHGDSGWKTVYAHLQQAGRVSGSVSAGQIIGKVGNTGGVYPNGDVVTFSPHLHWEQILNGVQQTTLYADGVALSPGSSADQTAPVYTSNNCTTSPPPDTDGDGTPDSSDACPNQDGPSSLRGCPESTQQLAGDFNNDGRDDVAMMYAYPNARTKIWIAYGIVGGFQDPVVKWDSTEDDWILSKTKFAVGDFTGDGFADIAAVYEYPDARVKVWWFTGTSTGLSEPTMKWDSLDTGWTWEKLKVSAGNINGDTRDDLVLFYDYPNNRTKIWIAYGISGDFQDPVVKWDSGDDGWDGEKIKFTVGDFTGDGFDDLAVLYKYPNSRSKLWWFTGTSTGLSGPAMKWDSTENSWIWDKARVSAGNLNGDARDDVVMVYDYPNARTKIWIAYGISGGLQAPVMKWDSGEGTWAWGKMKIAVGDFTADGLADLSVLYDYPDARVRLWRFTGTSTGINAPSMEWDSLDTGWTWENVRMA